MNAHLTKNVKNDVKRKFQKLMNSSSINIRYQ